MRDVPALLAERLRSLELQVGARRLAAPVFRLAAAAQESGTPGRPGPGRRRPEWRRPGTGSASVAVRLSFFQRRLAPFHGAQHPAVDGPGRSCSRMTLLVA